MPNQLRWRYGDTNPIMIPVLEETVIEIGDLVILDTDNAVPASAIIDQTTEALNQEFLHDAFAGVAMQASRDGDVAPIRVATSGVFEYASLSATYEVGDLIGGDEAASGTAMEDQVVALVPTVARAIGRCAKRVNPAGTQVLIDIVSTVLKGGPQPVA